MYRSIYTHPVHPFFHPFMIANIYINIYLDISNCTFSFSHFLSPAKLTQQSRVFFFSAEQRICSFLPWQTDWRKNGAIIMAMALSREVLLIYQTIPAPPPCKNKVASTVYPLFF